MLLLTDRKSRHHLTLLTLSELPQPVDTADLILAVALLQDVVLRVGERLLLTHVGHGRLDVPLIRSALWELRFGNLIEGDDLMGWRCLPAGTAAAKTLKDHLTPTQLLELRQTLRNRAAYRKWLAVQPPGPVEFHPL